MVQILLGIIVLVLIARFFPHIITALGIVWQPVRNAISIFFVVVFVVVFTAILIYSIFLVSEKYPENTFYFARYMLHVIPTLLILFVLWKLLFEEKYGVLEGKKGLTAAGGILFLLAYVFAIPLYYLTKNFGWMIFS